MIAFVDNLELVVAVAANADVVRGGRKGVESGEPSERKYAYEESRQSGAFHCKLPRSTLYTRAGVRTTVSAFIDPPAPTAARGFRNAAPALPFIVHVNLNFF